MNWKTPEDHFTVGFLAALFAGFVIIIVIAKGEAQPAWDWMHKWQTMIAGTFALVAAAIAWRAVRMQIAAEDRRERNRKKADYASSHAHLVQLRNWTKKITKNYVKLEGYEPPEGAMDDESLDKLIGDTLYVELQTSERLRTEMSVNTLMALKFVNQMTTSFRKEVEEVRAQCEGKITLFKIADGTLDEIQRIAADVLKFLVYLENTLSNDIKNVSRQFEEMEA